MRFAEAKRLDDKQYNGQSKLEQNKDIGGEVEISLQRAFPEMYVKAYARIGCQSVNVRAKHASSVFFARNYVDGRFIAAVYITKRLGVV